MGLGVAERGPVLEPGVGEDPGGGGLLYEVKAVLVAVVVVVVSYDGDMNPQFVEELEELLSFVFEGDGVRGEQVPREDDQSVFFSFTFYLLEELWGLVELVTIIEVDDVQWSFLFLNLHSIVI